MFIVLIAIATGFLLLISDPGYVKHCIFQLCCVPQWDSTLCVDMSSIHARTSLRPYLVVAVPSTGISNVHEAKNVPRLVQNKKTRVHDAFFRWGTPPPPLPLST